jgi:demethylmenaquinone methyltransferase/2-methoxy-6-polyprenyl-1,4-benzoquinol methylase
MNINREKQHFFNNHAREWDNEDHLSKVNRLKKIFEKYQIQPSGNILDVGCGTGILVSPLISSSVIPYRLLQLDFSREMIIENKKKHKRSIKQISFINGDALHLPFPAGTIQWLIGFAVLPHLGDNAGAIREWTRIISKGGRLLLLHFMSSAELNQCHFKLGGAVKSDHLLPVDELASLFIENGWKILQKKERKDLYLLLAQK